MTKRSGGGEGNVWLSVERRGNRYHGRAPPSYPQRGRPANTSGGKKKVRGKKKKKKKKTILLVYAKKMRKSKTLNYKTKLKGNISGSTNGGYGGHWGPFTEEPALHGRRRTNVQPKNRAFGGPQPSPFFPRGGGDCLTKGNKQQEKKFSNWGTGVMQGDH